MVKLAKIISISIKHNQVIFPKSQISIKTDIPMKQQSVLSAFQVHGILGRVRLSKADKVATWTPVELMPDGQYMLQIRGFLFFNGAVSKQKIDIPFFFVNSKAQLPNNVTVYYLSRIVIDPLGTRRIPLGRFTKDKYIEIMKAIHNKSDMSMELAYDSKGKPLDSNKIFKKIEENRTKKYGKLHESLYEHLENSKPNTKVDVSIWIRFNEKELGDIEAFEKTPKIHPIEMKERNLIESAKKEFERKLQHNFTPQRIEIERIAPVVYATLTKRQINAVAQYLEVGRIFLRITKGINDLGNSIAVAKSDKVHSTGFTGAGIKVGVWEWGPDKLDDLVIADFWDPPQPTNTHKHARLSHAIIKNIEKNKPHGHAPSCELYSANNREAIQPLIWAVQDKECTVINQSFHSKGEERSSSLTSEDVLKDWLIGTLAISNDHSGRRQLK